MQKELGLKITGKHAPKKTIEECKTDISNICNIVLNKYGRKTITYKDFNLIENNLYSSTYCNIFKENNTTIREYMASIGFELQKEGCGLNYRYDDGELIKSQYELKFSDYLRNDLKLNFGKDYLRDVKYSTFCNCSRGIDCDYLIYKNNKIIYVEVAGMLNGNVKNSWQSYKYKSNRKIMYVKHLEEKIKLLKSSCLNYIILFPEDFNDEYFKELLKLKLQ